MEKPEDSYALNCTLILTVVLLVFSLVCSIYNATQNADLVRDIQEINRRVRAVEQRP